MIAIASAYVAGLALVLAGAIIVARDADGPGVSLRGTACLALLWPVLMPILVTRALWRPSAAAGRGASSS